MWQAQGATVHVVNALHRLAPPCTASLHTTLLCFNSRRSGFSWFVFQQRLERLKLFALSRWIALSHRPSFPYALQILNTFLGLDAGWGINAVCSSGIGLAEPPAKLRAADRCLDSLGLNFRQAPDFLHTVLAALCF